MAADDRDELCLADRRRSWPSRATYPTRPLIPHWATGRCG